MSLQVCGFGATLGCEESCLQTCSGDHCVRLADGWVQQWDYLPGAGGADG